MNKFNLDGRLIGDKQSTFIIAELSANHLQNYDIAVKTIKAMKEAGADAVKLQTFTPDTITINCNNKYFQIKHGTQWDGITLYELYKKAYMPWDWQPKLKCLAEQLGLIFLSTPFDKTAVDFLESIRITGYKIASFEINDLPLIEYVASKQKPLIISTGIAKLPEIYEAVNACYRKKNKKIALLKCTSTYPTSLTEVNLRTIQDMEKRFKTIIGLSDHTLGISSAIASVALGAKIIEKHFILNRKLGGVDAAFSLEPSEFKQMVKSIREVELSMGKITYTLREKVKKNRQFARSLFVVKNVSSGERFTSKNVRSIRPGYGMSPKEIKSVLGKFAAKDISKGTPLTRDLIRENNKRGKR